MNTLINQRQEQIIADFEEIDDWMDRYGLLIEIGSAQPPIPEAWKTDQNLIEGCQSRVWLHADYINGRVIFNAESDAAIVKGIVTILVNILSRSTPEEILASDLYCIDRIGLKENLSPTRSNGLLAMIKQMRLYAMAYKALDEKKKNGL